MAQWGFMLYNALKGEASRALELIDLDLVDCEEGIENILKHMEDPFGARAGRTRVCAARQARCRRARERAGDRAGVRAVVQSCGRAGGRADGR